MKWVLRLAALLAVLAGLSGAVLCCLRERRELRIVKIEGAKECCNYSLSPLGWSTCQSENRPASLPLRGGDLLYTALEEEHGDELMVFPYFAGDGESLSLRLEGSRLLMQGRTVSMKLSADEEPWEWLREATDGELARLRFVELDDVTPSQMPTLKRLAAANPRMGLALGSKPALRSALRLFDPRWLLLDDPDLEEAIPEIVSGPRGPEYFSINASGLESLEFLAGLPELHRLVVGNWHPESTGPFPQGCTKLESLTISGAAIQDLSPIAHLTGLLELHLAGCDLLTDISALSRFRGLELLTLNGCEKLSDLAVLKKLRALRWLGLPKGITQDEFAAVVKELTGLRGLDLYGCENITDLGPLTGLPELESLVLLGPKADFAPLHGMKSLRLLVLPEELFEESPEKVHKLEEALPRCAVVAGGELCGGSGWILALFPAAARAALISRRRRARPAARDA